MKAGDFAKAEELYRSHFVQYLKWVHEHTVPMLSIDERASTSLVEVDVEALAEIADMVAHCMYQLDRKADIVPFLNHVKSVVPLSDFVKRSILLIASWLYLLDDVDGARRELKELGNILNYGRRDALEIYLSVFGSLLAARQIITIADLILCQAGSDQHIKVQYTAVKSIALLRIGEAGQAANDLQAVLSDVAAPTTITNSEELSTVWQLARAWGLYGIVVRDKSAFVRCEELLHRIPQKMLTPSGVAALFLDLGWALRDQERFQDSAIAFRRSLETRVSTVAKIHLAHSQALCGELDPARDLLRELEAETVGSDLQIEFLAARGALAIASADRHLAQETAERLRATSVESAYSATQRDQIVLVLLDFFLRPESTPVVERQRGIVRLLLWINEAVDLKPNVFGIGLNVNKLLEKFLNRFDKPSPTEK